MNAFKLPLMAAFLIGLAVACGKPEPDPGHGQTTPSQPQVIAVSSVSLDKTSVSLNVGESVTLAATVKPDNATNKTVSWSSSNASVASVDASGKVSAVAEGTATITAKAGDKTATCSVTVTKKVVAVESVTLDKSSLELNEGETATLTATVKPDNASDKTVTWSSSKTSVATVDANGKVTAVAEGNATITAKAGNKSATCSVTVTKNVVAVESITLDKSSLELNEGETATLVATVKPDNATNKTVTWSSSRTSVATVDANGKVTAVAEGTATITAKAGDKTATCSVTVKKNTVAVESVTLDKSSLELTEGETATLTATVKPDNATNKTVTWTSSSSSIATVDQNGKITAVSEGTATITAKAGDKTATCSVTVKKNTVAVESVTLDKSSLELTEGETATLTATVKPDNATNKTVTWSSDKTSVATVDANGKVTAVAEGTATITAKAGDKTATCSVTVKKNVIAVESVTLDITSTILNTGETLTLTATVKPDNATNKTVTWSSSNPVIATVDQNGKVTALAEGTATITAKAGDKAATCTVIVMKVNIPVESITFDKYYLELIAGETATITATVKPDNATDKTVTWSSSNPTKAAVDQSGKITAIAEGTVDITAKAGDKTATCRVIIMKVNVPVESVTLDKYSLDLSVGETTTLTATVKPDNATDKTVTWSSSNPSIATVDQAGMVSALAPGSATITVMAGDRWATCAVTVTEGFVPVESVTLDKTSLELAVGEDATLVATVWPANATNKFVSWTSDNTWIASVDQNGKVTAKWEGTAIIKAYAGDKSASCTLSVKPAYAAVESITLDKTSLELKEGDSATIYASVSPWNATNKTVTWTSSNPSVAAVDQDGNITAKKAGSATITASAENVSASCTVLVKAVVNGDPEGFNNENGEW